MVSLDHMPQERMLEVSDIQTHFSKRLPHPHTFRENFIGIT